MLPSRETWDKGFFEGTGQLAEFVIISCQLDRIVDHLNNLTQGLNSLESRIETGRTELSQLISKGKSKTDTIGEQ